MRLDIPFGTSTLPLTLPDDRVGAVLAPAASLSLSVSAAEERSRVESALAGPVGSPRLRELVRGKRRIAVITSDHTRPVPSRVTLPALFDEIFAGAPKAQITVVVATGCHRAMTEAEMRERFGGESLARAAFLMHDAADEEALADIGRLPSGGVCRVNRALLDAELLAAEGFIEPHFFAGFSGGRKAVLPGCAAYQTVLANHCAEFIADPRARAGSLDGNPIHADMLWAARAARLAFILNVVLDPDKRVIAAFAGDADMAHRAGCDWLGQRVCRQAVPADLVVTSNGGYPMDQNLYQAVKGLSAASATRRPGGVIIAAAACADGMGGEAFGRAFDGGRAPEEVMREILARPRDATRPDQWQIQILCRTLLAGRVIMVTGPGAPPEMVRRLGMEWAADMDEAMALGEKLLGRPRAMVTVVPDGVGVIVDPAAGAA